MKNLCLVLLVIGLMACQPHKSTKKDYQSFITAEGLVSKNRIHQFRFQGWQPLSDRYLILSSSQNKSYLIKLLSTCSELFFAQSIEIKQDMSSSLNAKFDAIRIPGQMNQTCTIGSIYPMNKKQKKALLDFYHTTEEMR